MSEPSERRGSTRFITILPMSILGPKGELLDARATAHDLTAGGFKAECQVALEEGKVFDFLIELPDGQAPARGKALAVWVKKHDFATWVGGKVTSMSWSDKRRLKAAIAPPGVEWGPIIDHALNALLWIVVIMALHKVMFERPLWRKTLLDLLPSLFALGVMGWALLGLLRRR